MTPITTKHHQYVGLRFPEWVARQPTDSAASRLAAICVNARVRWPTEDITWENCEDLHLEAIVSAVTAIHMEHEGRPTEPGVDEAVADALGSICTEAEAKSLFHAAWAAWYTAWSAYVCECCP